MINSSKKERIIVGISGASGIIYGIRLLECLRLCHIESHLIVSKAAHQTRAYETTLSAQGLMALADKTYHINDIAACLASGSYKTRGMVIAPCSMRTLADIASGTTANLLTRAADVVLKERRQLILMPRESPLHIGHLKNMLAVSEIGAIVAPPMPSFYHQPKTIDDLVNHTIGRILDLLDIDNNFVTRWQEMR